jgi:transposase-like protein
VKRQNNILTDKASSKCTTEPFQPEPNHLLALVMESKMQIENFSAQLALQIIRRVLEEEISQRCGRHGQQEAYRHGAQPGYVLFAGRKVPISRPRARQKGGGELELKSYASFQQDGKMQRAVARKLKHQVSTRNYAQAIDECLEGYGISRSSVSRQWKAATIEELRLLCQRPVPKDLVALLIDGQYFRRECLVVVMGLDTQGHKHVLGLWHGATENSTVVREFLAELRERGLNTEASILVVIDGAKALHKGIKEVFGARALIQRCRVHKLRNVLDHLPLERRAQVAWRLRGAWAKSTPEAALKELRACVAWLQTICPGAARSLEEGLDETLTITRLGLQRSLARTLNSTNLIESCFARTEAWTSRVKHWQSPQMVLRWGAAALLYAEKGFRRINGCEHLNQLIQSLEHHDMELASLRKAA